MIQVNTDPHDKHVAFEAHILAHPDHLRLPLPRLIVQAIYRSLGDARPGTREYSKNTRVYNAPQALAPELMKLEPFANNYGEGYISIPLPSPERSVEDNVRAAMWRAWQRETTKVARMRLLALLTDTLAPELPDLAMPTKARFSDTAGCTCPCSPGFILDARMTYTRRPIDLWIEVPNSGE